MATSTPITLDSERIRELTEREEKHLESETRGSSQMFDRANKVLAGGVASSYQARDPWPIYMTEGKGSRVWDVDGSEYIDFHNGFGSMVQGHAHPVISEAVQKRIEKGTHFALPTEDAVWMGEELERRWGLPQWRFVASDPELTSAM